MWFLRCEAPLTFVADSVEWHGESYTILPPTPARVGASLRVRAVFSSQKAYGLSRE
jgi:hypothetical protein